MVVVKDVGYAWVVCGASFMAHVLQCNLLYSRGMFYIIFSRIFSQADSGAISLVPSINTALTFGFAPVAGLLVSKCGLRVVGLLGALCNSAGLILASRTTCLWHLYLTYGVLTGIGIAFIYNPCITVLPTYFDRRLGLATGIAVSGCGAGFVVFQYFIKYLDDEYGWRGTLLILGAIQLHCILCAAIYRPVEKPVRDVTCSSAPIEGGGGRESTEQTTTVSLMHMEDAQDDESKGKQSQNTVAASVVSKRTHGNPAVVLNEALKSTKSNGVNNKVFSELKVYVSLLKNSTFMLFSLGEVFNVTADAIIYTHLGAFAMSINYSKTDAAFLFTIIGIANTLTRIIAGMATQRVHALWLCSVSSLLLAGCTLAVSFVRSLPLLVVYSVCFGGLVGPYHALPLIVTSELVDPQMLPRAMGLQVVLLSPGSLLGPLLAGVLFDYTGLYLTSFYMASGFLLLSGGSALMALFVRRFNRKKYILINKNKNGCQKNIECKTYRYSQKLDCRH